MSEVMILSYIYVFVLCMKKRYSKAADFIVRIAQIVCI